MNAKNAIKMKVLQNKKNIICDCCGANENKSLDLFALKIGDKIVTICDDCNEALFFKVLKASCYVDGRIKSRDDLNLINERKRSRNKIKDNNNE